jgi:hypothetical protein
MTLEESLQIIEESAEYYGIDSLTMVEKLVKNYKTLDSFGRKTIETFMDGTKSIDNKSF